eukprot:364262-Chlamydomonas_euryale.AAC.20
MHNVQAAPPADLAPALTAFRPGRSKPNYCRGAVTRATGTQDCLVTCISYMTVMRHTVSMCCGVLNAAHSPTHLNAAIEHDHACMAPQRRSSLTRPADRTFAGSKLAIAVPSWFATRSARAFHFQPCRRAGYQRQKCKKRRPDHRQAAWRIVGDFIEATQPTRTDEFGCAMHLLPQGKQPQRFHTEGAPVISVAGGGGWIRSSYLLLCCGTPEQLRVAHLSTDTVALIAALACFRSAIVSSRSFRSRLRLCCGPT